jgi:hypothetical protein
MRLRDVEHGGLGAIEIVHAGARMVVVHEIGPRIASFGPARGEDLLFWDAEGEHRRGPWSLRGGHRVWITRPGADESEETYAADDRPCRVRRTARGLTATAPPDATGLARAIAIRTVPGAFVVESRVTNASDMLWSGGLWALTCTRPRRRTTYGVPLGGGPPGWDVFTIVVPRAWGGGHTSRVDDPQIGFTQDCVVVRPRGVETKRMIQAPRGTIGMTDPDLDVTFLKVAPYDAAGAYPLHTNVAFYVGPRSFMVELETMGPQRTLPPGATLTHVETWSLVAPIDWSRWTPEGEVSSPRARPAGARR